MKYERAQINVLGSSKFKAQIESPANRRIESLGRMENRS